MTSRDLAIVLLLGVAPLACAEATVESEPTLDSVPESFNFRPSSEICGPAETKGSDLPASSGARPDKKYMPRDFSALVSVGYLTDKERLHLMTMESLAPLACKNFVLEPREIAAYVAKRSVAITQEETALLAKMWRIMEIPTPDGSVVVPRVSVTGLGSSPAVPDPGPARVPIAHLSAPLQDVARRVQLFTDSDANSSTITGLDLIAAYRSGHFALEASQFDEISTIIRRARPRPHLTTGVTQGAFDGSVFELPTKSGTFRIQNKVSFEDYNRDRQSYSGIEYIDLSSPEGTIILAIWKGYQATVGNRLHALADGPGAGDYFRGGTWLFEVWKGGARESVFSAQMPAYSGSKRGVHRMERYWAVAIDGVPYGFDCGGQIVGNASPYLVNCTIKPATEIKNLSLVSSAPLPGYYVVANAKGRPFLLTVFSDAPPAIQPLESSVTQSVRLTQPVNENDRTEAATFSGLMGVFGESDFEIIGANPQNPTHWTPRIYSY